MGLSHGPVQGKYTFKVDVKVGDRYEYISRYETKSDDSSLNGIAQMHTAMQVVSTEGDSHKWSVYVPGGRVWGPYKIDILRKEFKEFLTEDSRARMSTDSLASKTALSTATFPVLQYPENSIGIGESWEYTPQDNALSDKVVCTLQSVEGDRALVEAVFSSKDILKPEPFHYLIDLKTGMIIASRGKLIATVSGKEVNAVLTYERLTPVRVRYPKSVDNIITD
jgi:hypothetical protein